MEEKNIEMMAMGWSDFMVKGTHMLEAALGCIIQLFIPQFISPAPAPALTK